MSLKHLFFILFAILSAALSAQTNVLPFRPSGAAYSTVLDRIIFISGNPSQLHIYDPVAHTDQTVTLPEAPQNLSLSADGYYAAVALVDSVSYVNLQSASVVQTFTNVPVNGGVAILGSGYIYIFPGYVGSIATINISNGQVTAPSAFTYASGGIFNPAVGAVYTAEEPNLYRFNVGSTTPFDGTPASYLGVYNICGPLWLSPDNSKIFTGCANVFSSSSDTTKDMRYQGLLPSLNLVQNMAFSTSLNQIAAIPKIPSDGSYGVTYPSDTQVSLFDAAYYNPLGVFQTTPFTVGASTFAAHGRWVFYNAASTKMFVVTQADSTAALTMDFAIDTISLQNANSCNANFAASSASAIAPGAYATTQILSGEDCVFSAVSNVSWITLASGYYGSGNTALNYLVRPNLTSASRTGTITLGSQTFSVTQAAAGAASSVNPLSINPAGVDYDKVHDKIVMVTAFPNELHIYDPDSYADQIIPLPAIPLGVSVRPDGLFAAVGHHGSLSYVDLTAQSVTQTIPVDQDIASLVLASNGYAYTFRPQTQGITSSYSVQIATGALTVLDSGPGYPRLYANGNYLYVGGNDGVYKYDISGGPAVDVQEPNNPSGPQGGNIWLSEDGARLITSGGKAFTASTVVAQDLQPDGELTGTNSVQWAAESQIQHQTAVLASVPVTSSQTSSQLQLYSDNGLLLKSQETLASPGQYVFWNAAETRLFVVTQAAAASSFSSSFAVDTIAAPAAIPSCGYGVSPGTLYAVPGYGTYSFVVTSSCSWDIAVSASWMGAGSSFATFGNGVAQINVVANTGPQRSATVSIGNQTVNVIQAASTSTCTYTLSSTYLSLPLSGGIAEVNLNTQTSCPWSVAGNAGWLTSGTQSGVGPATIQFTAAANTAINIASVNIGGTMLSVSEGLLPVSTPLNFVPVTPCRVADTRNAAGAFGGPYITANSTRSFTIPSSACNIPSTASAYSLNVAVVPHGELGYLTAFATGQTLPFASTINSQDGRVKSTAAIVPAGTNGAASFYATNDTDLVLDINGYFLPSSSNTGLNYYVLNPCRVADTRNADSALGGPFLTASQQRDFPIQQSSCSVPSEAQAYSINIAAVPLTGELGYLTLWPAGESQPTVASLNAPTGAVTSNAALLPAGTSGDIEMLASNNTQAIIDINGYFAPASSSGLHFYAVTPCRVLDTRASGTEQSFTGTLAVTIGGLCGIPSSASAVVVNATVVPTGPLGYLTLWADGQTQPVVATLNASDAAITSNLAIVPMLDGAIDAFASNSTHLVVDVSGYFAP